MKQKICLLLCLLFVFAALPGCDNTPSVAPAATGTPEVQPLATPDGDGERLPTPEPTEEPAPPDATPEEPLPEGGHAWSLTPLGLEENLTFDLSGVGDATMVCFFIKDGTDGESSLWIEVDEEPYALEADGVLFFGAWLYIKDGVATLMTVVDVASEDYQTTCWQLVDGKPVKAGDSLFGTVEGATEDGEIIIGRPVDVLGTWWASRYYDMDEKGVLTPVEGSLYEIIPADDMGLKTAAKLPVELLGDSGFAGGEIPAGTNITPMATDDEQYFYFILDDGREGRIAFERGDYGILIDGKPETDYFGELMYAG